MYDFDKQIDRHGTDCLKWDGLQERYNNPDLLSLWVADMDWETPGFIKDALRRLIDTNPVLGYTMDPKEWWSTTIKWIHDHHGWDVEPEWLSFIPGIVKGIGFVINVFLRPDEKVIVQPPVYHPFFLTPQGNERKVVWNPLRPVFNADGTLRTYEMDFDNLEKVCDEKCRLLILSNPHNPCGICWGRETLVRLASFAKKHGLIVISDEIHCDLALYGNRHIPFATVSDEAAEVSITFSAPTKTFNMAGIVSSWSVVINPQLREKFYSWLAANELNEPTMFAPVATMAAFREGEEWRRAMLSYLEGNIDFIIDYCRREIPQISPVRPDASYLVWLDCRKLNLTQDKLIDLFENKAGLALNQGASFGKEGTGFMRMNVGCPRAMLKQAMHKLKEAIDSL
ncbi:MAG: PatB family C-S lyase [Bacteroidaceae bacterium]|nr:PatB family C-S lyase [Bacteroidaceae bacterium]